LALFEIEKQKYSHWYVGKKKRRRKNIGYYLMTPVWGLNTSKLYVTLYFLHFWLK